MNNEFELENMHQQMSMLKNKLNQQEIVNERLMRRSMRNEMNTITSRNYITMAIAILVMPWCYWSLVKLSNFSMTFWVGTCILMLICAGATFYNNHMVSDPELMSHSLIEAREKVARAKKFGSDWLMFGIPAIILWLAWFFYELYQQNGGMTATGAFWGGCVGAIIGTICGLRLHFKTQRQYQDIIDQIDDLTKE